MKLVVVACGLFFGALLRPSSDRGTFVSPLKTPLMPRCQTTTPTRCCACPSRCDSWVLSVLVPRAGASILSLAWYSPGWDAELHVLQSARPGESFRAWGTLALGSPSVAGACLLVFDSSLESIGGVGWQLSVYFAQRPAAKCTSLPRLALFFHPLPDALFAGCFHARMFVPPFSWGCSFAPIPHRVRLTSAMHKLCHVLAEHLHGISHLLSPLDGRMYLLLLLDGRMLLLQQHVRLRQEFVDA